MLRGVDAALMASVRPVHQLTALKPQLGLPPGPSTESLAWLMFLGQVTGSKGKAQTSGCPLGVPGTICSSPTVKKSKPTPAQRGKQEQDWKTGSSLTLASYPQPCDQPSPFLGASRSHQLARANPSGCRARQVTGNDGGAHTRHMENALSSVCKGL